MKRRTADEKHSPECTMATVKHDNKIMVWGCFAAHGVRHLCRVQGLTLKEQYIGILEEHDNVVFYGPVPKF